MNSLDGEIRNGRHLQQVRVYYEDTDFSGIVYHASYLRFMERGRTNYLRLIGADHRALFEPRDASQFGLFDQGRAVRSRGPVGVRREACFTRRRSRGLMAGLVCALLLLPCVASQDFSAAAQSARQAPDPAAIAEYRKNLKLYEAARAAFEAVATPYWGSVAEKRRTRFAKRRNKETVTLDDYVLTHPPAYSGPPRPVDPAAPSKEDPERPPVPVVADFLAAAKEKFDFVPQRPDSEVAYKRAYARVASAAGLTIDQAVRVYGFETGGNSGYDVQAGVQSRKGRAISTALGYNQLLTANSIDILSRKGTAWIKLLQAELPRREGNARDALVARIAALKRMTAAARSVPYRWSEHVKLGREPAGLGIHALNLDIDIGPLLQTQKLLDSVLFARRKGFPRPLTAAELEMMNLTGDGNGFDMVSMPEEMRDKVPTANFFQRRGYEVNSVVSRHNTVARLLAATDARMDYAEKRPGAKQLAAALCAEKAPDAGQRAAC